MSSKRKTAAFSEELNRVLGAGPPQKGKTSKQEVRTTIIEQSQSWGGVDVMEVADVLTAREDVVGERLSLKKGDLVEVLDTTDAKRPRLDLHSDPDLDLGIGADAASLLDNSSARHKMSVRPRRKHADPRARSPAPDTRWLVRLVSDPSQCGWVPSASLERRPSTCWPSPPSSDHRHAEEGRGQDAKFRREAVVRELVETEEEFGRDMRHVVDRYMAPVDAPSVPRVVRDNKTLVFGNLKEIAEFHNTVLIEGIKYYADEPRMIGKTFLRLERDFDKHVAYCRDEPQAQEFLQDTPVARDFYEVSALSSFLLSSSAAG